MQVKGTMPLQERVIECTKEINRLFALVCKYHRQSRGEFADFILKKMGVREYRQGETHTAPGNVRAVMSDLERRGLCGNVGLDWLSYVKTNLCYLRLSLGKAYVDGILREGLRALEEEAGRGQSVAKPAAATSTGIEDRVAARVRAYQREFPRGFIPPAAINRFELRLIGDFETQRPSFLTRILREVNGTV
ncbi:MAG: hypothetical protein HY398_02290 [Candidatus Doudnabacteria bacterium]|nr:hypothetical protein [Candidatus Doudnabacteria bacterium]